MNLHGQHNSGSMPGQRKEALVCVFGLLLIVTCGTLGFKLIEDDWTIWRALFFTLVTITTVGYGDEGISPGGEIFAAVLLIVGIATATYCLSSLVRYTLACQLDWGKRMQKKIDGLSGHFVICGFGRMGQTVCEELAAAGFTVVVIEDDSDHFDDAVSSGFLAIHGDCSDDELLERASVRNAQGVVCVASSDPENVFVTLSVRETNPTAFIACRAGSESAASKMKRAGANLVVSPYVTAGSTIASAIARPNGSQESYANCDLEMTEIAVKSCETLFGKSVNQVVAIYQSIVIVAVRLSTGNVIMRPNPDYTFTIDDVVIVAGDVESLRRLNGIESTEMVKLASAIKDANCEPHLDSVGTASV